MISRVFVCAAAGAALGLLAGLGAGCRAARPATPPAPTTLVHTFYAGTLLSGAQAHKPSATEPAAASAVEVDLYMLTEPDLTQGQPLESRARLITAAQGPPISVPRLLAGGVVAEGPAAAALRQAVERRRDESAGRKRAADASARTLGRVEAALPAGTTLVVDWTQMPEGLEILPENAPALTFRRLKLEISRPPEPVPPADAAPTTTPIATTLRAQLALDISRRDATETDEESEASAALPPKIQQERMILEPLAAEDRLEAACVIPWPEAAGEPKAWVALLVRLAPGRDDPDHAARVAEAMAGITLSAEQAAGRPSQLNLETDPWPGLAGALKAMENPNRRRAALVYLSEQTGARLSSDIALVAEDEVLEALAGLLGAEAPAMNAAALGWRLDRAALEVLTTRAGKGALPPALEAILIVHCGQAARQPDLLWEACRDLTGRSDFEKRLKAENLIALEDNSPAARVRAYDWLKARQWAPPDFDPLGSERERRKALRGPVGPSTPPTSPSSL